MKFLRDFLDKQKPHFEKGGKFEKFYYIYEAHETLLFSPNHTTGFKGVQVRDAIDLKRLMITVVISMIPTLIFGIWNVGHQHFLAVGEDAGFWDKMGVGAWVVLPIVVVSYAVGLSVEFTFATIRRHPINEGFLVTGMLIPLIMPPTIPLWQVALATIFGVIIGKEVFGGTGMNILNPALTARAFLYFAYPSDISGEVWTYFGDKQPIDAYSGATALGIAAEVNAKGGPVPVVETLNQAFTPDLYSVWSMFFGTIPGSIGETSFLMCMIGALILIVTGVGSWKIILSVLAGTYFMGVVFNLIGANPYMLMPAYYHLLLGGLAFGAVYMATDPVSASQTETGKWIYGFLIGVLTVLIRVVNPAYPEGIMLAILLMNVFAPLIDYYIVEANKKGGYNVRQSNTYIIVFSAVLTIILGGLLSLASVGLGPQQKEQMDRDNKRKILAAVMDLKPSDDVLEIYEKRIQSLVVDVEGNVVGSDVSDEMFIAEQINISKEFRKPPEERLFPVFKFMSEENPDKVESYIIPMNGNGLWNEISGFLALETDLTTIKGVVFDHVGETPGLGARITEGSVQARYEGKKVANEAGELISVQMVKRETGDPSIYDEYQVDGLSGATMTANGVNDMLKNYLSFYQPYFEKVREQGEGAGEENIDQETGGDEFTTDPESL